MATETNLGVKLGPTLWLYGPRGPNDYYYFVVSTTTRQEEASITIEGSPTGQGGFINFMAYPMNDDGTFSYVWGQILAGEYSSDGPFALSLDTAYNADLGVRISSEFGQTTMFNFRRINNPDYPPDQWPPVYLNIIEDDEKRLMIAKDRLGDGITRSNLQLLGTLQELNCSGKITTDSIEATTYLNLPPTPASDLLPITLDQINGKVGINETMPFTTLHVVGDMMLTGPFYGSDMYATNVNVTNKVTTDTIEAVTYLNLPPTPASDLLPITLDKTNNRVGINQTVPTEALDVTGNILASGSISGDTVNASDINAYGSINANSVSANYSIYGSLLNIGNGALYTKPVAGTYRVGINTSDPQEALDVNGSVLAYGSVTGTTLGGTLSTANQPNVTSLGTLTSLTVTGDTNIDSNTLKVDSTNNRVGIVNANPTESLDVTGNIKASGSVTGTTLGGTLSTANQPNVTSLGTLTSLTVTGDTNIDSNTLKVDSTNNRIGILTATPGYNLDVNGTANITGNTTIGSFSKFTVDNTNGRVGIRTDTPRAVFDVGVGNAIIGSQTANASLTLNRDTVGRTGLDVYTGYGHFGSSTTTSRVGINVDSPAYNLDVNGTTNITGNTTIGGNLTVTGKVTPTGGLGIGNLSKVFNASSQTFPQGTSTVVQVDNVQPGTYIFSAYLQASSTTASAFYCGFSRNPTALTYVPDDGNNIGTKTFEHYQMGQSIALYKTTIMTIATTSTIAFVINNNKVETITTIAGKCGITYIKLSS